jgi:hypothetical protein
MAYISTDFKNKRGYFNPCYEALKDKVEWLPWVSPQENINRLQE